MFEQMFDPARRRRPRPPSPPGGRARCAGGRSRAPWQGSVAGSTGRWERQAREAVRRPRRGAQGAGDRDRGSRAVPVARTLVEGAGGARALGGDRPLVAVVRGAGGDRLRRPGSSIRRRPRRRRRWRAPARTCSVERELWRVEAGRGGDDGGGVFDLSFDWSDGHWQLVGCAD